MTGSGDSGEAEIRGLIEAWADAVRRRDHDGVLRDHAADMLMFDLPPPLRCRGLDAYRATWDLFFAASPDPAVFDIVELEVTAGADVGFAAALMRCVVIEPGRPAYPMEFRLTVGLRRIGGGWTVTHEHHSIPAAG